MNEKSTLMQQIEATTLTRSVGVMKAEMLFCAASTGCVAHVDGTWPIAIKRKNRRRRMETKQEWEKFDVLFKTLH